LRARKSSTGKRNPLVPNQATAHRGQEGGRANLKRALGKQEPAPRPCYLSGRRRMRTRLREKGNVQEIKKTEGKITATQSRGIIRILCDAREGRRDGKRTVGNVGKGGRSLETTNDVKYLFQGWGPKEKME